MEIIPGIHLIDGVKCNCYLVVGDSLVLIDTGLPNQAKKIINYITHKLHRRPDDLKTVILTHCDIDHIGSAKELRRITGAKIASYFDEVDYIAGRKQRRGPNPARKEVDAIYRMLGHLMILMKVQPLEVDIKLLDGETIADLKVIRAPGHTEGSMALYHTGNKVLFTGDAMIYTGRSMNNAPPRVTMDIESARLSFRKLKSLGFDIMLGGHGKPLMPNASIRIKELTGS
jgi:hydroxyacylglutathione hydrolase